MLQILFFVLIGIVYILDLLVVQRQEKQIRKLTKENEELRKKYKV